MELTQFENGGVVEKNATGSLHLPDQVTPHTHAENLASVNQEPIPAPAPSAILRKDVASNHDSQDKNTPPSVSNCYVFKSRLQEYCQKAGLTTPVYETIKEGPSHEPSFRSAVIVNDIRYDSLPGFFNRKAAEQSAAEVALLEISKSVDIKFGISLPVHETGLCKNLLQEYAQKMNYAIPLYECQKEEKHGRLPMYSCVVEIGGIKYIGTAASTKKEAEIKAARTALLAIQSSGSVSANQTGNSTYTVIPQKKKVSDLGISTQETAAALKPKKGRFKKQQQRKKRWAGNRDNCTQATKPLEGQAGGVGLVGGQVGLVAADAVNNSDTSVEVVVEGQPRVEVNATEAINSRVETDGVLGVSGVC